jgi:hypothetical protein
MDLGIKMIIKFCGCEPDPRTLSEEEFKKINLINTIVLVSKNSKNNQIEEIELEEIDIDI